MNEQEYISKVEIIEANAKKEHKLLAIAYAKDNSDIVIGDVVTDHIGSVRVEKIAYENSYLNGRMLPQCVYFGIRLTQKGDEFKNGKTRWVHQYNLKINESDYTIV